MARSQAAGLIGMQLRQFLSYWSVRITVALLVLISLGCTQVPLFDYLGFEFSALVALVLSLLAGLLTISLWQKSRGAYAGRILSFTRRCALLFAALLAVPFVIISANAFFVKNCSFLHGTLLFLLIPVPAVLLAHSVALVISALFEHGRRTWFVLLWFFFLFHILYVTFTGPQIFAFNPVLGFFPGFTYDESLEIIDRLLLYRIGTLAFAGALLLPAVTIDRRKHAGSTTDVSARRRRGRQVAMMTMLLVVAIIYIFSNKLGLSSSESFIRSELGGYVETDHFVISYPDSLLQGRRLSHVVQLHEFHFSRLARALRVSPARKIHTFLYASDEQKQRLVGAAGTNIAKPWLWQVHLNLSDVEGSLSHELTHVMAAEFGFPLLRIGVNAGLIEGLATAVERTRYDEHVHRLASMVFAVAPEPDMRSLFSFSGFIRAHPGVSYTLAGSFCRFLIDRYGLRRFKLLYRTGNFVTLYNKDLNTLLWEWRRTVRRYRLSEGDLEKAAYLFKRPSIFAKECAREVANVNADTRALFGQRRFQEALESAELSLELTTSIEAIFQCTNALVRLQRFDEAIAFARGKLQDSTVRHSLITLKLLLGDGLWAIDSVSAAKEVYAELLRAHLSLAMDEAATIRLEALSKKELARDLKPYYVAGLPDSTREELLRRLLERKPNDPLPRYLLARQLASSGQYESAAQEFERTKRIGPDLLEMLRQRMIGHAYFELGKYQKAQIYYWQSLNYITDEMQGLPIEQRISFCQWMEEYLNSLD